VSTGVIAGVGTALPEVRVTTDRLAGERGPEAVRLLREVGFEAKHQPVDDVSPWHLATEAARRALSAAQVEAQDVDLVLTVGLPRGEYRTWALSLAVQNALGMTRAAGLDLGDTTGGSLLAGLRVLKAKFAVDARRQIALLLLPHRFSDMVDLTRPGDRWLWPLGDGGVALVVKREGDGWAPLDHAFATDGAASRLLTVRCDVADEGPYPEGFYEKEWALIKWFTLRDPDRWYADYRERAGRHLPAVILEAVKRSGLRLEDVACVQAGYLYPEIAEHLAASLGPGVELRRHNAQGMLGGAELGFALRELAADPALQGKHVVLVNACLPAHFGAMVLRMPQTALSTAGTGSLVVD
jgi:3-oxoacyl-[acyl-carrier-protein] synthase-3